MADAYSNDLLFPNKIVHSWTHEGMYYAITNELRVMRSSNKFKYSATEIGTLPSNYGLGTYVWGSNGVSELPLETGNEGQYRLLNVIVRESVILHEENHGELGIITKISKDYGQSWKAIDLKIPTPDHLSLYEETQSIWRGGLAAFMIVDNQGCDIFIFKPMFRQKDDDTFDLSGWLVFDDDGVLVHSSADAQFNKLNIEHRFEASGELIEQYDNKLNTMDGHHEKYRKPYVLRWPQYQNKEGYIPRTIDHSGFIVNAFDVVSHKAGGKSYWIIQIPQELHIRLGLLAEKENKFLPDRIRVRIPIHYVVNTENLKNATTTNKAPVRVLDLHSVDTYLAPLHKAHVTTRAGVYSFVAKLIGKSVPVFSTYGAPGTVYTFDAPSGETFTQRVTVDHFVEHSSGDLLKITDPEFGQDVTAFLYRDRIKVCVGDPSREHNWVDKTKESTFVRTTQRVQTDMSIAALGTDPNNARRMTADIWCGYDTVLRYDFEGNRLLGYPIYAVTTNFDPASNLIGYNFPAFIRTSANNYTVGYATQGGLEYRETNVTRQFNLNEEPTDAYNGLYYGGFVGDTRGYIGSLSKFVNGITVPPEPEIPTEPVPNPPTPTEPPLPVPSTIALMDDITHSTTAIIAPNRQAVEFNLNRGSAISNIAVGSSKWYIELNAVTTKHLFFGVARSGFDVNKEPGDDSNVVAVGMEGQVIRGGTLVYKTSSHLIDFTQGGTPTIGVVIDLDNRLLQFTSGDGSYYSQAIGGLPAGSLYFFIGATANTTNNISTSVSVNYGQLPFKYTVPNGVHRGYGIA